MRLGVLALQGAVEPHKYRLQQLGVDTVEVREPKALQDLNGIILPGGESTTMVHLLRRNDLWQSLKEFALRRPTWGVCAGAILMAKRVSASGQNTLEVMNISVERNAYGRQLESFIALLDPSAQWVEPNSFEGVFIRAPKISDVWGAGQVLFRHMGSPVMVEESHLLVTTFHPELTDSSQVHEYFIRKCEN